MTVYRSERARRLELFRPRRQGDEAAARRRARKLWPDHPGLRGAYLKGWRARSVGDPRRSCPYRARPGWRSVWRSAWEQGWLEGPS